MICSEVSQGCVENYALPIFSDSCVSLYYVKLFSKELPVCHAVSGRIGEGEVTETQSCGEGNVSGSDVIRTPTMMS